MSCTICRGSGEAPQGSGYLREWLPCVCLDNLQIEAQELFPCCGGSDENPPEHTQDCVTRVSKP